MAVFLFILSKLGTYGVLFNEEIPFVFLCLFFTSFLLFPVFSGKGPKKAREEGALSRQEKKIDPLAVEETIFCGVWTPAEKRTEMAKEEETKEALDNQQHTSQVLY